MPSRTPAEMRTGVSLRGLVRGDVVAGGRVQLAQQDLLVVQREARDRAATRCMRLRGLERVAVLQRVLLERDRRQLLARAARVAFFGGTK